MFRKKAKVEEQRRARQDARKAVLAQFEKEFDEIMRGSNAVEKFERLRALRDRIGATAAAAEDALTSDAEKRQLKSGMGFGTGAVALTIGIVIGLHFPPALIALCMPLYLGAGTLGGERVRDHYLAAERPLMEPFIEALKAQQNKADAASKDVIAASLKNLGASADLSVLLAAAPQLRDEFGRAGAEKKAAVPVPGANDERKARRPHP